MRNRMLTTGPADARSDDGSGQSRCSLVGQYVVHRNSNLQVKMILFNETAFTKSSQAVLVNGIPQS